MKSNHIKYLFLVLLIACGYFSSCKKIPFDSRNKYWGTWKFNYLVQGWGYNGGYGPVASEEHTGEIYYDKKNKDKTTIFIIFSGQISTLESLPFNMDKSGNFVGCIIGKFNDKSNVEFVYTDRCVPGGALGGIASYTVTGKKQ